MSSYLSRSYEGSCMAIWLFYVFIVRYWLAADGERYAVSVIFSPYWYYDILLNFNQCRLPWNDEEGEFNLFIYE